MKWFMSLAMCAAPLFVFTATATASEVWTRVRGLEGRWTGHETGSAGTGVGTRTYERILDGRFVLHRNTSHFEPQSENPKGETHEDLGIFSLDGVRDRVVFRQFYSEGFINTFVEADSSTTDHVVFVTEAMENAPLGWTARLTLSFHGDGSFLEVFELDTGSGFGELLRNTWTRLEP